MVFFAVFKETAKIQKFRFGEMKKIRERDIEKWYRLQLSSRERQKTRFTAG
jgi:hypothetical protein